VWARHTTEYYWNTDQLVAELSSDGRVRIYVYADPVALTPLLFLDYESPEALPTSCRCYFIFSDQIGTPSFIEDSNGTEMWRGRIDPFGNMHVTPGSRLECNLRFPGHYYDAELGLHYNRYRHYHPILGRYLQSDPWGIAGGFNLYAYPTNPLLAVDVRGLGEGGQDEDNKDPAKKKPDEEKDLPAKPHGAEGDPPPKMSKEDGEALARQKNAEYRAELDKKIAAGDMSQRDAGPVAATVVDRKTGEAFSAHNDRNGNPPDPMHPLVAAQVAEAQANPQHPSDPGSHAEVHALNDAVSKREADNKANGLPPVTKSDLDDFTQVSEWRKGSGDGRMKPGDDAPRCGNCQTATDGVDNRSGDAPPWPPPYN
jgi:RHS repeat-associated protein